MANTIQEFLVALGFKVDQAGLANFQKTLETTHRVAKEFVITITGLAVAMEEATRRTARQFENLFFLAQQTGVAADQLKAAQFAFGQVQGGAEAFNNAVTSLAQTIRENPQLKDFTKVLTGETYHDPKQALEALSRHYKELLDKGPAAAGELAQFTKAVQQYLHISDQTLYTTAINLDRIQELEAYALETQRLFHIDAKKAAQDSLDMEMAAAKLWDTIKGAVEHLTTQVIPRVTVALDGLIAWLRSPEVSGAIKYWEDQMVAGFDWVVAHAETAATQLEAAYKAHGWEGIGEYIGHAIVEGIKLLPTGDQVAKWSQEIATNFVDVGLAAAEKFLEGLEKGILDQAPDWLKAIIQGTEYGLNKATGAKQGGQQEAPAIDWGAVLKSFIGLPEEKPHYQHGGIVTANLHAGEMVLPADISAGLQAIIARGSLDGGGGSGLENSFRSWWVGSTAFRPLVDLVPEVFNKLADMLRDVFNIKPPTGGTEATPAPGSQPGPGVPPGGQAPSGPAPAGQWYTGTAAAHIAEHGGFNFAGLRGPTGFRTYANEYSGVADVIRLLQSKTYAGGGTNTLRGIISKWAPGSENNLPLLLQRAHDWTGWNLDQPLDMKDPATMQALLGVLNRNEFGGKRTVGETQLGEYVKRWYGGENTPPSAAASGAPADAPAGAALPGSGGKFSAGNVNLDRVMAPLRETLQAAATMLGPGYEVRATSGERPGETRSQHFGGHAMDVELIKDGKVIPNRGEFGAGAEYARLAHAWYQQVSAMHPELLNKAEWGGEFGTALGGGGQADFMHFDFGGRRGRHRRGDWAYPEAQRAAQNTKHEVTINVHGAHDSQATAQAVLDRYNRQYSQGAARNIASAIA